MKRNLSLAAAIALTVTAGTAAGAVAHHDELSSEAAAADRARVSATAAFTGAHEAYLVARDARNAAAAKLDARTATLDKRPAFLEAVTAAGAAFASASGKVDAAAAKAAVLRAQTVVLGEKEDPSVVTAQTAAVRAAATDIASKVKAYDKRVAEEAAARQRAQAQAQSANSSKAKSTSKTSNAKKPSGGSKGSAVPNGWISEARRMMAAVGGSGVLVQEYDGMCGNVSAIGCAWRDTHVWFDTRWYRSSPAVKWWAVYHEHAHTVQWKVITKLRASPTYATLFRGNIEKLAECMVRSRGQATYGRIGCNPAQIAWAGNIYKGVVKD